jgi:RNA polymerase sigma-70 factor (ECF subfamily)
MDTTSTSAESPGLPQHHKMGSPREVKLLDEELLIRKTFETDPKQGCEILFRKYYHVLCSHAVRLVYSRAIAEDLVAELFCKLWTDKIYLNITTSYRAYLFKAVRFSAYNYIRWELGKTTKVDDLDSFRDLSSSFKPEEALLFEELVNEIEQIVDNLPAQCKRVFLLSRFENKKYKEIADELGISVKSVEAHISKALDTIRKGLKASGAAGMAIALSKYIFLST